MVHSESDITHVSDTALMVAACRAHETELEDAFVRDPFASRLAGERGKAILDALPHSAVFRFGLAIRTRLLDELLLEALAAHPITTVLSVGCGLDTRPWRLGLAPDFRWIEVDFADMLDYKEQHMAGETARCHRERLVADVNDSEQRRAIYKAVGSDPALMITEGLLMYLPASTVGALALESGTQNGIAHWISDITTSAFTRAIGGGTDTTTQPLRHVQAPDCLKGEQILDVLERHGWETAARRSYITDIGFATERIRRMMGGATPPPLSVPAGDQTGVHRFVRG